MTFNWEKFQEGYLQASEATKETIDSNSIVRCATTICNQHSIPTELRNELTLNYTQVILKLMTEKEFLNFVNLKIKPDVGADKILSSLMTCVATNEDKPESTIEEDIAETEAVLGTLPSLRTMEEDSKQGSWSSQEEPTHSSSQDSILQETPPPTQSEIPPPPPKVS